MAEAMILTDHYLPQSELRQISETIKSGEEVKYPQEAIDSYIEQFESEGKTGDGAKRKSSRTDYSIVLFVIGLAMLVSKLLLDCNK